jgi:hypothetical protein
MKLKFETIPLVLEEDTKSSTGSNNNIETLNYSFELPYLANPVINVYNILADEVKLLSKAKTNEVPTLLEEEYYLLTLFSSQPFS